MTGSLVGTPALVRFAIRRDRWVITAWTAVLIGIVYVSAVATDGLYPTIADQVVAAEAINASPATVALYGPLVDPTSRGEVAMTKMTVLYAAFVLVLTLVLVRRHTRVAEEQGQAELLGSTAIGGDAPLAAALAETAIVVSLIGLLAGLADIAGGLPVAGSILFGVSWWGIGLVGMGLAGIACQISASARTCAMIGSATIATLFLARAVGDTRPDTLGWLSWLSPLGWGTKLQAWSEPRLWVIALYLATALSLCTLAVALRRRRDLGSGLVAPRPGPAQGSPRLADALALAVRVHTPTLMIWTAAAVVLGLAMGSIVPNIGSMLDTPAARAALERFGGVGTIEDTAIAALVSIVAAVMTGFAVAVVTHASGDEVGGRTEQVLSTAISRERTFTALVVVALAGATWLLAAFGMSMTLGYGGAEQVGDTFARVMPAALVQAPALWVVASLAVLAIALRSRWGVFGWAVLVGFLVLGQIAELLGLPTWVSDLSPYSHTSRLPIEQIGWGAEIGLTAIAAVILTAAWLSFRVRDIG